MLLDNVDPDNNFMNSYIHSLNQNQSQYCTVDDYNDQYSLNSSQLTIFHSNICSFHANIDELSATLSAMAKKPDIIVLTETWLNKCSCAGADIEGYDSFHTFRDSESGRGGGVSVFLNSKLASVHITNLSISSSSVETAVVTVTCNLFEFVVLAVYRPHSGTVDSFIGDLGRIICDEALQSRKVVLLGDMNVNLCLNNNRDVNNFVLELQSMGFFSTISEPTRFPLSSSGSKPSLLDHIWINFPLQHFSGILTNRITDHCPVFIHISCDMLVDSKIRISFRDHSPTHILLFKRRLSSVDWSSCMVGSLDDKLGNFNDIINEIY